jgi:hypothetical protein
MTRRRRIDAIVCLIVFTSRLSPGVSGGGFSCAIGRMTCVPLDARVDGGPARSSLRWCCARWPGSRWRLPRPKSRRSAIAWATSSSVSSRAAAISRNPPSRRRCSSLQRNNPRRNSPRLHPREHGHRPSRLQLNLRAHRHLRPLGGRRLDHRRSPRSLRSAIASATSSNASFLAAISRNRHRRLSPSLQHHSRPGPRPRPRRRRDNRPQPKRVRGLLRRHSHARRFVGLILRSRIGWGTFSSA